ncbi:hypothetical protein HL657_12445 [Methanoculleus sp. YWC-01]|uniref:Uncharacterized protein n=1 Tax=Methanoculleus nereidis TaxID=2735141 RepID=A0ABU3Z557_9EURY|nr:hypothetical protein [Methanoculleus sp. YWC-01]MDV4343958.1 hypothetical protein [Methanoculleus sp. YWC-01]
MVLKPPSIRQSPSPTIPKTNTLTSSPHATRRNEASGTIQAPARTRIATALPAGSTAACLSIVNPVAPSHRSRTTGAMVLQDRSGRKPKVFDSGPAGKDQALHIPGLDPVAFPLHTEKEPARRRAGEGASDRNDVPENDCPKGAMA